MLTAKESDKYRKCDVLWYIDAERVNQQAHTQSPKSTLIIIKEL